jgi:hypothetical protein
MDSHFWDIVREIRSLLHMPDDALLLVQTSIGAIALDRFVYRAETGCVFGVDSQIKFNPYLGESLS